MKDIYVYEDTNVLINKFDIRDQRLLEEREGIAFSLNGYDLVTHPFPIESVFDIKSIHKMLFSDLYDWAGENRKINIYKDEPILNGLTVNYTDYKEIDTELAKLDYFFAETDWENLTHDETIDKVVVLISRLWRIHCFREGNTRATTVFLYMLMKQWNMKVQMGFIGKHAKFFRNALVMASIDQYSEYEHLKNILLDSVAMKETNTGKYKTIREYEVDKYQYRQHKYKD